MSSEPTGGNADFTQSANSSTGVSAASGTAGASAGTGYAAGADLSFTIGSATPGSGTDGAKSSGSSGGDGAGLGSLSLSGDAAGGGSSGTGTPTGGNGNAAAQQYYFVGSGQPLSFSLLPSSTGAASLDGRLTNGAGSAPLTASFADSTLTSGAVSLDLFALNTSNEALYGPGLSSVFDGPSSSGGSGIDQYAKGGNGGGSTHGGGGGGGGHHGGSGGGSVPSNVIYGSSGSLQFNVTYDSSVTSASNASTIESAFATAIGYFTQNFDNSITVNLEVGWGEAGGQALPLFALGENNPSFYAVPYSVAYNAMDSLYASGSSDQQTAFTKDVTSSNPFPNASSNSNIAMTEANLKALNIGFSGTTYDDVMGFASSPFLGSWDFTSGNSGYDFIHVAEHEISEGLGRVSGLGTLYDQYGNAYYSNLDLFRYSASGVRSTTTGGTGYLSFDGGQTNLSYFNTDPSAGDLGDWSGQTSSIDAYNYANGTGPLVISSADTRELNVLGYNLASTSA